jgi:hypothetical protein
MILGIVAGAAINAEPVYVFATLNPSDNGGLTLSAGNLKATRPTGSAWLAVRSTIGRNTGKWYFEITNDANGSTDGDAMWGFNEPTDSLSTYPGASTLGPNSMGWEPNLTPNSARFQDGSLGAVSGYGRVAPGQYARFAIDFDAGKLWVRNSSASGWAGGGDPAAGTSPTFTFTANTFLHVAVAAYSQPQAATCNFGESAFSGSVPSGFNPGFYGAPNIGAFTFDSRFTAAESANAQGVATDGTHLWYASSGTLYKYTMAGSLVTSRSVTGDNPTDKNQINGLFIKDGVLYASAAKFSGGVGTSWVVEYDPDTLTYIDHHAITGDWFSEGLAWRSGAWWMVFHANKVVAKIDPSSWAVLDTYTMSFPITGSSGGYGAGTGYDGIAWVGDYLLCNVHEIYDQNVLDLYYWNGAGFEAIKRYAHPTSMATQGLAADPTDPGVFWFAERNYSGTDSIAKVSLA